MKQNAIIVSVLALFIAVFPLYALAAQTWVTPNGTVIDWYGNIISQPESVILLNAHPASKPIPAPTTNTWEWQSSSFKWNLENPICAGHPLAVYNHCMQMLTSQE